MSNIDSPIFGAPVPATQCKACAMSHGPAPYENGPTKGNCIAYPYDEEKGGGLGKPIGVLEDKAECPCFTPLDAV